MNIVEWSISTAGTATLLTIVIFFSRNWFLERLKNSIQHEYNEKLEKHKSELKIEADKKFLEIQSRASIELEKFKMKVGPYSEKQFEHYNQLWIKLIKLRRTMEALWIVADENTLNDFSDELNDTFNALEESALLIEQNHFSEVIKSLDVFAKYQIGKRTIRNLRHHTDSNYVEGISEKIEGLISNNEQHRKNLNEAMQNLMNDMRRQINGGN